MTIVEAERQRIVEILRGMIREARYYISENETRWRCEHWKGRKEALLEAIKAINE